MTSTRIATGTSSERFGAWYADAQILQINFASVNNEPNDVHNDGARNSHNSFVHRILRRLQFSPLVQVSHTLRTSRSYEGRGWPIPS
jgi:hypothetical protein